MVPKAGGSPRGRSLAQDMVPKADAVTKSSSGDEDGLAVPQTCDVVPVPRPQGGCRGGSPQNGYQHWGGSPIPKTGAGTGIPATGAGARAAAPSRVLAPRRWPPRWVPAPGSPRRVPGRALR